MNLGVLVPIVAILASAWVFVTILRTRESGAGADKARLVRENEELRRLAKRLEERVEVLERIATDPSQRTAREIDELR